MTTDGIVIKETNIGESDRVVTLLTRQLGIIRAFVTNARKITNKNSAASSLLCYGTYTVYKTKDAYRISESEPKEMFFKLRSDIEKLAVAQYLCELSSFHSPLEEPAEDFLRLLLNSLHFLTEDRLKPLLIKSITEFRLSVLCGYMPDFVACGNCACYENDKMFFLIDEGRVLCGNCYVPNEREISFLIDKTLMATIRHILYSDFAKLYAFNLPDEYVSYLNKISEKYIISKTEQTFKTLNFLHSLSI